MTEPTTPNTPTLWRDRSDAVLGGVCAALARKWQLDPKLVRIGMVIAAVATSSVAFGAYLALWLLIPDRSGQGDPVRRWLPFTRSWSDTTRTVVVIAAALILSAVALGAAPGGGAFIALVVGLILLLGSRRGKAPAASTPAPVAPPGPPRTEFERLARTWDGRVEDVYSGRAFSGATWSMDAPPPGLYDPPGDLAPEAPPSRKASSSGRAWFGILVGGGIVWGALATAASFGVTVVPLAYASGILGVLGLGLLWSAGRERRPFALATATVLVGLAVAGMLTGPIVSESLPQSTKTFAYSVSSELPDKTIDAGMGATTIDLRELTTTEPRTVRYTGDVGSMTLLLPQSGNVVVNATVDLGSLDVDSRSHSGFDLADTYRRITDPDAPTLTVNLHLDVGQLEVRP